MDTFGSFMSGVALAIFLIGVVVRLTEVNISDDELYRFCIVQKIELKDCKIPENPVAENKNQIDK